MIEVVGVRFKSVGKIYYFDPKGLNLDNGSKVIVETVRGQEIGEIVIANRMVEENDKFLPLSPVIRVATTQDMEKNAENKQKEHDAFSICEEKILKHKLDMTLINVEYTFDNSKIIFNFVSEGRVDFRELVKDLAAIFKTRIELRQIGVRDETKTISGLGVCGRKVCCSSFLSEFVPVSVKMARDQSLSTNPQKISGACGKLICCLNYEQETYDEAYKTMPRVGSYVETPKGKGVVTEVNVVAEYLRVKIDGDDGQHSVFKPKEIKLLSKSTADIKENDDELLKLE